MTWLTLLLACGAVDPSGPAALPVPHAAPPVTVVVGPLVAGFGAKVSVAGAPQGTEALLFASQTLSPGRTCPRVIQPACLDVAGPVTLLARGQALPGGVDLTFQVPAAAAGSDVRLAVAIRGPRRAVPRPSTVAAVLAPSDDADADGLINGEELRYNTDPFNPDTDGGGVRDGLEVDLGTAPREPADDPLGACQAEADCTEDDWCADVVCSVCTEPDCAPVCAGACSPRDWCTADSECADGAHCTTTDGACEPDPSCPGCDVCTGACVPDVPACFDSSSCPAGERCTTEDGVCDPVTLCDADGACVDVCAGTCVTDEEAPQTCLWGEDCPSGVCSLQQLGCDPRYAPFCVGVCLEVVVCLSDDSCAAGERCTTDDGACDPVTLCDADGSCADVCGGTCVPDSPPPSCVTGEECPSGLCSLQHFGCDPRFAPFCLGLCLEPESCFTDDNCAAGALCSTGFGDCFLPDCPPDVTCVPVCTGWCGPTP